MERNERFPSMLRIYLSKISIMQRKAKRVKGKSLEELLARNASFKRHETETQVLSMSSKLNFEYAQRNTTTPTKSHNRDNNANNDTSQMETPHYSFEDIRQGNTLNDRMHKAVSMNEYEKDTISARTFMVSCILNFSTIHSLKIWMLIMLTSNVHSS